MKNSGRNLKIFGLNFEFRKNGVLYQMHKKSVKAGVRRGNTDEATGFLVKKAKNFNMLGMNECSLALTVKVKWRNLLSCAGRNLMEKWPVNPVLTVAETKSSSPGDPLFPDGD